MIGATTGIGLIATVEELIADPQLLATVYIIVSVPVVMPVAIPVAELIAAFAFVTDHIPPDTAVENATDVPWHTADGPVMGAVTGVVFTVS